jgi:hypothetical protein
MFVDWSYPVEAFPLNPMALTAPDESVPPPAADLAMENQSNDGRV